MLEKKNYMYKKNLLNIEIALVRLNFGHQFSFRVNI